LRKEIRETTKDWKLYFKSTIFPSLIYYYLDMTTWNSTINPRGPCRCPMDFNWYYWFFSIMLHFNVETHFFLLCTPI